MSYTQSAAVVGIGSQLQSCATTNGTYGTPTTISEILEIALSGSKADEVDVTNMDSVNLPGGPFHEFKITLLTAGEISFEANFIGGSTSQQQLNADFLARQVRDYVILHPNGTSNWKFQAFVTKADFKYPVKDQITLSGTLKITGPRTFAP